MEQSPQYENQPKRITDNIVETTFLEHHLQTRAIENQTCLDPSNNRLVWYSDGYRIQNGHTSGTARLVFLYILKL